MKPPELSVIIVNWNVRDLLRACLTSIANGRGDLALEVIVVDSASSDGSGEMIRDEFPWVKLIACDENVGFPRGNNLGLREAQGMFLLLLNPDTEILDNALQVMIAALRNNPSIGAVGPQLVNPDGTVQSSRRRFPTLATGVFESTWLQSAAPRRVLDGYYVRDLPDDQAADVDWVTGACIMVPQAVHRTVGGLDEAYYMYSEELDWCRRIKQAGFRVVFEPAAKVLHHAGKSSEQAVTARHVNFQRAKLRYFRKYHGRAAAGFLRAFLLAGYAWELLLESTKGLMGHRPELRRQRVRAYYEVLKSGLKPAGY